jgi:uncharacterized protein (DUF342 family)
MDSPPDTAPEAPEQVTLTPSEDNRQLQAMVPAGGKVAPLNLFQLKQMMQEAGYGDWHLINEAVQEVCKIAGKLEQARAVVVAECLDGEVAVQVAGDAGQAFLSVTPPQGGDVVDAAKIRAALAAAEITHGIKDDAIQAALAAGAADKVLIAEATPPQHGEDTRFESLIPTAKGNRPTINADGTVDYHNIHAFVTISAGDALMRKHPPTSGSNGIDVHGKAIPAKAGKELGFAAGLQGVEIDSQDRDLLRAVTGGQPEVVEAGMRVNPVISVKNVDLSTGNIDFDGTVNIKGDVVEGMVVHATGDIVISGMTEGAELHAGGNIVISKGVIGRGEVRTENGEVGQGTARLTSGGSVEARFIENAIVTAGDSVLVGEFVSHCEIAAGSAVTVGKKGAKKGHILGGKTQATQSVEAQVLGSQAHIHTLIEVGSDPELNAQMKQITEAYETKLEEQKKLNTLLVRLRNQSDAKSKAILVKVVATLKQLNAAIKELHAEKESLAEQYAVAAAATVKVGKQAFSGVTVVIGDRTYSVHDATEAGEFVLDGKKVVFELR